jgi:hypothetical protein
MAFNVHSFRYDKLKTKSSLVYILWKIFGFLCLEDTNFAFVSVTTPISFAKINFNGSEET